MPDARTLRAEVPASRRPARSTAVLALAVGLAGIPLCMTSAEAAGPQAAHVAWSPLEGKSFHGEMLSTEGEVISDKEKLVFRDGQFASEACRKFGFGEGPYWLRVHDGKVHFIAETVSPTNGTMRWQGTISGGRVDASFVWTKERWYWTIEREFRVRATQEP